MLLGITPAITNASLHHGRVKHYTQGVSHYSAWCMKTLSSSTLVVTESLGHMPLFQHFFCKKTPKKQRNISFVQLTLAQFPPSQLFKKTKKKGRGWCKIATLCIGSTFSLSEKTKLLRGSSSADFKLSAYPFSRTAKCLSRTLFMGPSSQVLGGPRIARPF